MNDKYNNLRNSSENNEEINKLLRALYDPRIEVSQNAVNILGLIGKSAVTPLINLLKNKFQYYDPHDRLGIIRVDFAASQACHALELIGEPSVLPLIDKLNDDDSDIRGWSAIVLGKIGDERAIEPLIKALGDQDTEVRCFAASALGKIGDNSSLLALVSLYENDTNADVRDAANNAIKKLKDRAD
jgi:HEAT repeat protein